MKFSLRGILAGISFLAVGLAGPKPAARASDEIKFPPAIEKAFDDAVTMN
jgi:hypothetical protein